MHPRRVFDPLDTHLAIQLVTLSDSLRVFIRKKIQSPNRWEKVSSRLESASNSPKETKFLSPGTMRNTIVPGFTFGVFHGKIECQSIQKAGLYHAF